MTPAFKHRLLGTSILVLIGIIFLPDLLDGEKQVIKDDFKVIPDRPEFQGEMTPKLFEQQAYQQQKAAAEKLPVTDEPVQDLPETSPAESELPPQQYAQVTVPSETKPATNNQPLAESGWVVRVGSFSNVQNANALSAKLRQAGYVTFTRDVTNSRGQKLTSVIVGPDLRKDRLEQQLAKLQQITGIEKLSVTSWQPAENN